MHGFGHGILQQPSIYSPEGITKVAEMYVEVVTRNIESFLTNKTKVIRFDVDNPEDSIYKIWEMANMEGDIQKALQEWRFKHNQS
jgi:histone acetyltransferase (RNA polymerase elongator complex component)